MKILIACEFSGKVRNAFYKKGHDVVSCDLLPSDIPGNHYQGDVMDILYSEHWGMLIGFPECTYRCNSGVRWMSNNPDRLIKLNQADLFFMALLNSGIPKICIENPIPHHYSNVPKYSQIVQPWMFGDNEQKSTCLWLKGLPNLIPDIKIKPSNVCQSTHNMAPGKNRGHLRSITFNGIADAMAKQWGI